jgi:ketosteroid isomerase-like protein
MVIKTLWTIGCLAVASMITYGQSTKDEVLRTNQRIDAGVVDKDMSTLEKLYAPDFVFKHGTGTIDDKESWLRSVSRPEQKFVSRIHDSTRVELHEDIALVSGTLTITRLDGRDEARYKIWYIRIFRQRDDIWQLISHHTTREIHL